MPVDYEMTIEPGALETNNYSMRLKHKSVYGGNRVLERRQEAHIGRD